MESPKFINNNNCKLYSVLHTPNKNQNKKNKNIGIVLCSPFAEEKLISHRTFVSLSRKLAMEGYTCLRFDYMGHGDSDGNFEDATVKTRVSDINCALKFLKTEGNFKSIGCLGVRFGSTLSTIVGCEENKIDFLISISPIVVGEKYIQQCLRINLAMQLSHYRKVLKDRKALIDDLNANQMVNIDGYLLSRNMYEGIKNVNLLDLELVSKDVLLIQISNRKNQPIDKDLKNLYEKYCDQGKDAHLENIKWQKIWQENNNYSTANDKLTNTIIEFLNNIY